MTDAIWLLYAINLDNRSGEEFFWAFVGKPSYEEFIKVLHVTEEVYKQIVDGTGSSSTIGYFMREQG